MVGIHGRLDLPGPQRTSPWNGLVAFIRSCVGEPIKRSVRRLQTDATVGLHVAHSVLVNVCGVFIFNRICRG